MMKSLPGGLSPTHFLRDYWHKRPLLIQSLNHFLPEADALLAHFNFISHARLDDLMVSYAVTGGSVGPHFDSYDVVLLQGPEHRRWQISAQSDLGLLEGTPLPAALHKRLHD